MVEVLDECIEKIVKSGKIAGAMYHKDTDSQPQRKPPEEGQFPIVHLQQFDFVYIGRHQIAQFILEHAADPEFPFQPVGIPQRSQRPGTLRTGSQSQRSVDRMTGYGRE